MAGWERQESGGSDADLWEQRLRRGGQFRYGASQASLNNYIGGGKGACTATSETSDGWGAARHMQGTTGAQAGRQGLPGCERGTGTGTGTRDFRWEEERRKQSLVAQAGRRASVLSVPPLESFAHLSPHQHSERASGSAPRCPSRPTVIVPLALRRVDCLTKWRMVDEATRAAITACHTRGRAVKLQHTCTLAQEADARRNGLRVRLYTYSSSRGSQSGRAACCSALLPPIHTQQQQWWS